MYKLFYVCWLLGDNPWCYAQTITQEYHTRQTTSSLNTTTQHMGLDYAAMIRSEFQICSRAIRTIASLENIPTLPEVPPRVTSTIQYADFFNPK
jgi:hypothetical protein